MNEAVVWRTLFDMLDYRLLASIRDAKQEVLDSIVEYEDLVISSLQGAAGVMRAADLSASPSADLMWRQWNDMFHLLRPTDPRVQDVWTRLEKIYIHLSVTLVAWYLHVGVRASTTPDQARRALQAAQRRATFSADQLLTSIEEILTDEDEGAAAQLWDQWTRAEMPEREVVLIESLRTGLQRLLVFSLLLSGPSMRGTAGEWARFIQDDEVRQLSDQLIDQLRAAAINVSVTTEMVMHEFRRLRQAASREYAKEVSGQPIDDSRLERLRIAAVTGWEKYRELTRMLDAGGAQVVGDSAVIGEVEQILPRALLVSDTDVIGEDWLGTDLGRIVALREAGSAVQRWISIGRSAPESWSAERIFRELTGEDENGRAALIIPNDWEVAQWTQANRSSLEQWGVSPVSSLVIAQDQVLLVAAAGETWDLAVPSNTRAAIDAIPLEASHEDARVRLRLIHGISVATGLANCLTATVRQLLQL
jgi:hypothetical protein